jgi:catechol 2,3-dioxygenase-like lactoylglutathione lyase family enzyme
MTNDHDPHSGLHSDQGALAGEHPGRATSPVVKVHELAWLEFTKPDLDRAELFGRAFGFTTAMRAPDEVQLRGSDPGAPCVLIRKGARSQFLGVAFRAADSADVLRLAEATGRKVTKLPESLGGVSVDLVDPNGQRVRVVADTHELPALPGQAPLTLNFGHRATRTNATQRPPRQPAAVQRPGHLVLQTTTYRQTLDWYLEHLGLIVSDFLYYRGQRERGPVMSFIRCDRGETPTDHHTLALVLGPANRYVHSAYEVADLDALAAGGEYLREQGYRRSWGIGRHIQGSQIFDYWRDPDGFLVEHYADGDLFDCTLAPGWAPMTASGLAQWGPPATKDFLGVKPGAQALAELRAIVGALRQDNEFDLRRLGGLLKVATS